MKTLIKNAYIVTKDRTPTELPEQWRVGCTSMSVMWRSSQMVSTCRKNC